MGKYVCILERIRAKWIIKKQATLFQIQLWGPRRCNLRKILQFFPLFKQTQNFYINMNIFFQGNWQFHHKCCPSISHKHTLPESLLTVWQNMKSRGLQKSQFPYSLVNWEKFKSTKKWKNMFSISKTLKEFCTCHRIFDLKKIWPFDILPKQTTCEVKALRVQVYIQQWFHDEQGAKFIKLNVFIVIKNGPWDIYLIAGGWLYL